MHHDDDHTPGVTGHCHAAGGGSEMCQLLLSEMLPARSLQSLLRPKHQPRDVPLCGGRGGRGGRGESSQGDHMALLNVLSYLHLGMTSLEANIRKASDW